MNIKFLTLFALLMAMLTTSSCHSRDAEPRQRPSVDKTALDMRVGDTERVTVSDCTELRAKAESGIIEVTVEGCEAVTVRAIAPGTTSVSIYANGSLIRCRVTVTEGLPSSPDDPRLPDEPTDDSAQLADPSWRYVSTALTMSYDTPGTIFARSSDGLRVTVRSLNTGDNVELDLEAETLTVNGEAVLLDGLEIVRSEGGTRWIKAHTSRWGHTVWVVTR